MDVTDTDVTRIPVHNLHVPRADFVALWKAAEALAVERPKDWYAAGVVVTCRWLANASVRPASQPWRKEAAPVTQRHVSAYEELIEAECLAAEKLLYRSRPHVWLTDRPGWVEAIVATLCWAWRRTAPAPIDVAERAGC